MLKMIGWNSLQQFTLQVKMNELFSPAGLASQVLFRRLLLSVAGGVMSGATTKPELLKGAVIFFRLDQRVGKIQVGPFMYKN